MLFEDNVALIKTILTKDDIQSKISIESVEGDYFKDLVILIPTHNRHELVEQSMRYYKILDYVKIVYIDSSDRKYQYNDEYDHIEYIHFPGMSFIDKMIKYIEISKAQYICTCADDDFLMINQISKGYSFLTSNKDYGLYFGQNYNFSRSNLSFTNFKVKNCIKDIRGNKYSRGFKFFSNYQNVLWSMFKREQLLCAFKILKEARVNNDNFYEIAIGATLCYFGNVFYSNEIWAIRESIDNSWGQKTKSLLNILWSKNIQDDYVSYRNATSRNLDNTYGDYTFIIYITCSSIKRIELKIKRIVKFVLTAVYGILKIQ